MDCGPSGSCPWDSSDKNTGVGCHALLQGILSTQGLNPGFLHCRRILYCLNHQGSLHGGWKETAYAKPRLGAHMPPSPPDGAAATVRSEGLSWPLRVQHLRSCLFLSTSPAVILPFCPAFTPVSKVRPWNLRGFLPSRSFLHIPKKKILKLIMKHQCFTLISSSLFPLKTPYETTSCLVLSPCVGEFPCFNSLPFLSIEFSCPGSEPVSLKWKQRTSSLFCSCRFTSSH